MVEREFEHRCAPDRQGALVQQDERRLLCVGVLHGRAPQQRQGLLEGGERAPDVALLVELAGDIARLLRRGVQLVTGDQVEGVIRYVAPVANEATRTFTVELELDNASGDIPAGTTAQLNIPAESIFAQKISPSLLTLDSEGNLGVKIVNDDGQVEFYPADIAMSSTEGIWIAGLPNTSTIITVGQGFVMEGASVDSVTESDVEIAVAVKSGASSK